MVALQCSSATFLDFLSEKEMKWRMEKKFEIEGEMGERKEERKEKEMVMNRWVWR